jgi:hypothetical protein
MTVDVKLKIYRQMANGRGILAGARAKTLDDRGVT